MRAKLFVSIVFIGVLLAVGGPVSAHHGAAAYDMSKPAVLKGAVVTKFAWINPHAIIGFDVKDDAGTVTHWTAEIGSPAAVALVGWNRTTLKPGDVITAYVWQSKKGLPVGRLNKIVMADGTVMRDSQTGADNGGRADNDVK